MGGGWLTARFQDRLLQDISIPPFGLLFLGCFRNCDRDSPLTALNWDKRLHFWHGTATVLYGKSFPALQEE